MTDICYRDLGGHRKLSSIVFAGSHDAAITNGKSNAQTQNLDIAGQAKAGVRLFDLRILAEGTADGASLVGYHGKPKSAKTMTLHSDHTQHSHKIKVSSGMKGGTTGEKLSDMLVQGREFVERTSEFLIFKFDKCKNWPLIAEYCATLLGGSIYKAAEDSQLGDQRLSQLAGKVICVFAEKGLAEVTDLGPSDGILGFRNLNGKDGPGSYDAKFSGLQYFGKGGTNPAKFYKTQSGKMSENEAKQRGLMAKMANSATLNERNVLGMMYWTSTGLLSSIESRNNKMWEASGVQRMQDLWANGLDASIAHQMDADRIQVVKLRGHAKGHRMRAFFPNVVMIDFADPSKCRTIYQLNDIALDKLTKAYDAYMA